MNLMNASLVLSEPTSRNVVREDFDPRGIVGPSNTQCPTKSVKHIALAKQKLTNIEHCYQIPYADWHSTFCVASTIRNC